MEEIRSDRAPKPAGHYAQTIEHMGMLLVSGQLPVNPRTGVKEIGPIEV